MKVMNKTDAVAMGVRCNPRHERERDSMSELGSLYIKLGEPEGELCGCTCEVGDWAAKHIVDLTEQRDKLLAALELLLERMELPPDRNCSCHISPPCNDCVDYSGIREAIEHAETVLAKVKGGDQ